MKLKVITYFLMAMMTVVTLSSCSEETPEVQEYVNWKEVNDAFMTEKFEAAKAGKEGYYAYRSFTLSDQVPMTIENSIVMKQIEKGSGTECPLYNDSVRIHYTNYLLKSNSYQSADDPELGLKQESTFSGTFDEALAHPVSIEVHRYYDQTTQTYQPWAVGFTTALMHMHVGDRYKVYIPYQLAYGETGYLSVPGYSTLVFDIRLVAKSHSGEALPIMK